MNVKSLIEVLGGNSIYDESPINIVWKRYQLEVNMTNIHCGNPDETKYGYNYPCEFKQINHHERFIRMRADESWVS